MTQQFGDPHRIFDIGFTPWHSLDVLRVHHEKFKLAFEQIVDRTPVHASRNLAKRILEWEYGIEIARPHLLLRTEEQRHTASDDPVSSHEGTCSPGAGVSYGQAVLAASPASGGHRHV